MQIVLYQLSAKLERYGQWSTDSCSWEEVKLYVQVVEKQQKRLGGVDDLACPRWWIRKSPKISQRAQKNVSKLPSFPEDPQQTDLILFQASCNMPLTPATCERARTRACLLSVLAEPVSRDFRNCFWRCRSCFLARRCWKNKKSGRKVSGQLNGQILQVPCLRHMTPRKKRAFWRWIRSWSHEKIRTPGAFPALPVRAVLCTGENSPPPHRRTC